MDYISPKHLHRYGSPVGRRYRYMHKLNRCFVITFSSLRVLTSYLLQLKTYTKGLLLPKSRSPGATLDGSTHSALFQVACARAVT
jgi:hypothetical protein